MKEFRDRLEPEGWKRSGKICTENTGLAQDVRNEWNLEIRGRGSVLHNKLTQV